MRRTTPSSIRWPPREVGGAELAAIRDQLTRQYVAAEKHLLDILTTGDITSWKRAFTQQQLAQVRQLLANLDANTVAWARFHLPTLYEAGLAVVDGYLMQPELAATYRALRADGMGHMDAVRRMAQLGRAPGGLSVAAHPGEITPMDLGFTRLHREAVEMLGENLVSRLGAANRYAGQWVEIMAERAKLLRNDPTSTSAAWFAELQIREASLETLQNAFLRGETQRQASKEFRAALKRRGIHTFTDRAGRSWPMRRYSDMVVQTVCQEVQRHAVTNRMIEAGQDIVEVSDHAEECELCAPWEGERLSLTGATAGMPTLNEALGEGLMHPRCTHVLIPWIGR